MTADDDTLAHLPGRVRVGAEAWEPPVWVRTAGVGFKVTNELSDMTPCTVRQLFADTFDRVLRGQRHVFNGIRLRSRFDTGVVARGVAVFGDSPRSASASRTHLRSPSSCCTRGLGTSARPSGPSQGRGLCWPGNLRACRGSC